MAIKKTFICRFKLPDGMFTMVSISGYDLNEKTAEMKAIDYMKANGRVATFVTAYEYTGPGQGV